MRPLGGKGKVLRRAVVPLVVLGGSLVVASPPATAAKPSTPAPSISDLFASPATQPFSGGTVTITAAVTHATSCTLTSTPVISTLPESVDCSGGSVSEGVSLPPDTTGKSVKYVFELSAVGTKTVTEKTKVTVAATPPPTITNLEATPGAEPAEGGTVTVSATVTEATSCTLSTAPVLPGLPEAVDCLGGTVSVPLPLPANAKKRTTTYKITFVATGTRSVKARTTATVTNTPAPVISSFTVTPSTLPSSGGPVTVSAALSDAASCTLSTSGGITGLPSTINCSGGSITVPLTVPQNTSKQQKTYTSSCLPRLVPGRSRRPR